MTDQKRLTAESGNHTEQNTPVLSDLIARLGEATGPDRELDARLHEICIGAVWRMPLSGPWLSDGTAAVPAYTESIDAAMQLVPKGYDWIIGRTNDGMTIHACCGSTSEYFADTPPLALCIAALNSVREPSADGDPSLQRTLSEPLAASAPAGDGGEVKLLEWEEQLTKRSDEDPSTEVTGYEAETAFGTFYTVEVGAALFHVVYDYKGLGAFETEIAAKAAAQADYEQRIRSALYARPAPAVEVREGWRYEIQHGPDGETDYAWVYDDKNNMVCTTKTHHAMAIVAARGGISLDASDVHYLGAIKLRLERLYEENPNDCRLREHISDEVSWIDGLTEALSASPREMGQESDGNESQAKATEGKAGMAGVDGPVRRSTAGTGLQVGEASADLPATSEIMDVTAGRDRQPIHESDGGSMEQPFALADAARESPAPRASSGKQEGRTGSEVGAEQIAGSSMSYGPDKPIIAGQAPGPSEPSPSSRSETAWQSIETAPKDNSAYPIQVCGGGFRGTSVAWWHGDIQDATHWAPMLSPIITPSPDCSGCMPSEVQKEDATRIEGSMQSDISATKLEI